MRIRHKDPWGWREVDSGHQSRACPEENIKRVTTPAVRNMTLVMTAAKEGNHEGGQHAHQDRTYTHVHGKTMYVRHVAFSLPASGSGVPTLP